jgi:hypothetical protein
MPTSFESVNPQIGWTIFILAFVVTGVTQSHFLWVTQSLGGDFAVDVWNPTHALVHGINPFIPSRLYEARYSQSPAAMYTPDTYVILAPAIFVPVRLGAVVFFSAMLACTWATVLVVIRPWTTRRIILGALLGTAILFSLPSEDSLSFGQPTALLAFGVALTIRASIRRDTGWIAVIGVTLALLKVQTGVPIVLVLLAVGTYSVVIRAIGLTLLLSSPGIIAELRAAHGLSGLIRTSRMNLQYLNEMNATFTLRIRVDLAGTVYRLDHYDITILQLVLGLVLAILAVVIIRHVGPGLWMWPFISSFLTLVLYHQEYDVLVPLLCFIPILLEGHSRIEERWLCLSLIMIDLACRPTFIPHWLKILKVQNASFSDGVSTITTLILLAIAILATTGAWLGVGPSSREHA